MAQLHDMFIPLMKIFLGSLVSRSWSLDVLLYWFALGFLLSVSLVSTQTSGSKLTPSWYISKHSFSLESVLHFLISHASLILNSSPYRFTLMLNLSSYCFTVSTALPWVSFSKLPQNSSLDEYWIVFLHLLCHNAHHLCFWSLKPFFSQNWWSPFSTKSCSYLSSPYHCPVPLNLSLFTLGF